MSVKTAGVGHFQIPTAPAALTAVAQSASANTLGAAVSFGNSPSALYITGVFIGVATTQVPTYVQIQILVAAGIVASVLVPYGVSSGVAASVLTGYRAIFPPIPVANAAALTVKSASSVASAVAWGVSLECIAQANVVDDAIPITTVTTVTNQLTAAQVATGIWQDATAGDFTTALSIGKSVMNGVALGTGLTVNDLTTKTGYSLSAAGVQAIWDALTSALTTVGSIGKRIADNLDALISSRMATYTQPTGFLAATFPASVASPTNITAGVITTATNLTNAPTAGDLTAAMKTSVTTAASAATPVATVSGDFSATMKTSLNASTPASVGAVTGAVASVTANVNADVKKINGTTVNGNGAGTPWGP